MSVKRPAAGALSRRGAAGAPRAGIQPDCAKLRRIAPNCAKFNQLIFMNATPNGQIARKTGMRKKSGLQGAPALVGSSAFRRSGTAQTRNSGRGESPNGRSRLAIRLARSLEKWECFHRKPVQPMLFGIL